MKVTHLCFIIASSALDDKERKSLIDQLSRNV